VGPPLLASVVLRIKLMSSVQITRENELLMRKVANDVMAKLKAKHPDDDVAAMVESALAHCALLDELNFDQYVVSLKDSHPRKVIEGNMRFAALRPEVPLHLGVTEAGIPPEGIIKTRVAFEQLLSRGIGDTIRVSLTLPNRANTKRRWSARGSWTTSRPAASARSPCSTTTS